MGDFITEYDGISATDLADYQIDTHVANYFGMEFALLNKGLRNKLTNPETFADYALSKLTQANTGLINADLQVKQQLTGFTATPLRFGSQGLDIRE